LFLIAVLHGRKNVALEFLMNSKKETKRLKELFVEYYKRLGSLGEACEKAGIKSRRTVRYWIETDSEFADLYQDLKANRADQIKTKLYLASQGELALTAPQVTAGIFLLKAFDPQQFAEKYQMELGGKGGKSIPVAISTVEVVKDYGQAVP